MPLINHVEHCDCILVMDPVTGEPLGHAVEVTVDRMVPVVVQVWDEKLGRHVDVNVGFRRETGHDYVLLSEVTKSQGRVCRCARHEAAGADHAQVRREYQAKEKLRELVRKEASLPEAPDWQRGKDGGIEILLPDNVGSQLRARVQAKVAAHPDAGFARLTTVAELAVEAAAVAAVGKPTDRG